MKRKEYIGIGIWVGVVLGIGVLIAKIQILNTKKEVEKVYFGKVVEVKYFIKGTYFSYGITIVETNKKYSVPLDGFVLIQEGQDVYGKIEKGISLPFGYKTKDKICDIHVGIDNDIEGSNDTFKK